jgi:hypothetical protein
VIAAAISSPSSPQEPYMNLSTNLSYGPLTLAVSFDYSPATPDVFYLRNGDPGYPGSAAELSILSITSPQAPGISFLDVFSSMDAEHDLGMLSIIEDTCLSAAELSCSNALAREAALDAYYESLRTR